MRKKSQTEEKPKNSAEKQSEKIADAERSVKDYQFFLIRLAIFALAIWLVFFVFVGTVRMPSNDMKPSIAAGDLVIFYRLDKDVKAQDVIVVEKNVPELGGKQTYVCRVVAVAGDTVDITDNNRLVINGNVMLESNIYDSTPRYEGFVTYPVTLGEGECFVLADHREGGTDSRWFGPVVKKDICGTVITVVRKNNL